MKKYITAQGDTWDQIALKCYGTELAVEPLLVCNGLRKPELLTVWRFSQGEEIEAPERSSREDAAALPAWRLEDA